MHLSGHGAHPAALLAKPFNSKSHAKISDSRSGFLVCRHLGRGRPVATATYEH